MTQPARKVKKDHETQFRTLLQQKRDELIRRLYERRAELHGENDPDDEAAVAVESVVKELALTNMEREIRTLAEVELSLRRLQTDLFARYRQKLSRRSQRYRRKHLNQIFHFPIAPASLLPIALFPHHQSADDFPIR